MPGFGSNRGPAGTGILYLDKQGWKETTLAIPGALRERRKLGQSWAGRGAVTENWEVPRNTGQGHLLLQVRSCPGRAAGFRAYFLASVSSLLKYQW